jgi:Rv2525c-like, glycoside hydrolase-like domain
MALQGRVAQAAAGLIGFDETDQLNTVRARQYFNQGYRYCIRYISHDRTMPSSFVDLTEDEAQAILDAGMALTVVQHPLKPGWTPSGNLGQSFGNNAAAYAGDAGLPRGVNVFLDLEGVQNGTPSQDVIDFCNAWFAEVEAVGYVGGVYIGADPGLTGDQLYWNLKTKHYWKGGSSAQAGVPDDIPHRGYQMIQYIENPDTPQEFDRNVTKTDNFSDAVLWLTGTSLVA